MKGATDGDMQCEGREKEVFLSQRGVLVLVQREQRQGTFQLIQGALSTYILQALSNERVWVHNWDDRNIKKQDKSGFGICMFQKARIQASPVTNDDQVCEMTNDMRLNKS